MNLLFCTILVFSSWAISGDQTVCGNVKKEKIESRSYFVITDESDVKHYFSPLIPMSIDYKVLSDLVKSIEKELGTVKENQIVCLHNVSISSIIGSSDNTFPQNAMVIKHVNSDSIIETLN